MTDGSPSSTPEKSRDEASGPKRPKEEGKGEPKKDSKFTAKQIFEFGGLAGVLVVFAEILGCHDLFTLIIYAVAINFLSLLPLHFVYELLGKSKKWIPILGWFVLFAITALIVLKNSRPEPRPNLTISLQIGGFDDTALVLTNDFLHEAHFNKTSNLSRGRILFNGKVRGAVFIPVLPNETKKTFTFAVGNSSVDINGFEAVAGFPKDWECITDTQKWQKPVDSFFMIPGWKLEATNMQYFLADGSGRTLYTNEQIVFPGITVPCSPEFIGNTIKGGLFEFSVRAVGFETVVSANIVFVPVITNSFKPFVSDGEITADGKWRTTITPEEYERSQQ